MLVRRLKSNSIQTLSLPTLCYKVKDFWRASHMQFWLLQKGYWEGRVRTGTLQWRPCEKRISPGKEMLWEHKVLLYMTLIRDFANMSHLIMDYASSSFIFGSGLCSASSAAGGRSPDQHIGQALLLTLCEGSLVLPGRIGWDRKKNLKKWD